MGTVGVPPNHMRKAPSQPITHRKPLFQLRPLLFLFGLAATWLLGSESQAGITGENVVVVVNAKSAASMTVANHFGELRQIPDCNFVFLEDVPDGLICSLAEFKEKILRPVLKTIEERKLSLQTRVVAYSTHFPTTVQTERFLKEVKDPTLRKIQSGPGSITGLTYLYQLVLSDNASVLSLNSNLYARGRFERHFDNPFPNAPKNAWTEASKLQLAGAHSAAGDRWMDFFREHPTQAPAALLAGRAFAQANDDPRAIASIEAAIAAGWRSASYFREDEVLSQLMKRNPLKASPDALGFGRLDDLPTVTQAPLGFSSNISWSANGWPNSDPNLGMRYLPSCMLGVIDPRGSNLEQVLSALSRSADADHSFPKAGFQFTNTKDVRSKTRLTRAASAAWLLESLGFKADLIAETAPEEEVELTGLMLGTASFDSKNPPWSLVPGAISENLTSFACNFRRSSQTKSTELIHCGAGLTCGPVAEPYAIANKFPDPMLYTHYARGAVGMEAIFLSLHSPYQTLVIGDPLVAAFAEPPNIRIKIAPPPTERNAGQPPKKHSSLVIQIQPGLVSNRDTKLSLIEIFLEGRLVRRVPGKRVLGRPIRIDDGGTLGGSLEVRVAAVNRSPLQTRKVQVQEIDFGDMASRIKLTVDQQTVMASCEGASKVEMTYRRRLIASSDTDQCRTTLERAKVGAGPVRIRVFATVDGKRFSGLSKIVNVSR